MADADKVEKLPKQDGNSGKGAIAAWIPAIAIIIAMPVISYAMTMFLILPKIESMITSDPHEEDVHNLLDDLAGDSGGGGGGHGGGHGGGAEGNPHIAEIEGVVANLTGSLQSRYVKVSFTLQGKHDRFADIVKAQKPKIVDASIGVLSSLSVEDIEEPGVKNVIRNDLLAAFESALGVAVVEQLYFSEFVVQ